MEKLQIGPISLTWLNGGVTHMDGGAMFGVVPKPLWIKKYPVNEFNQIELRTDPILIQTENNIMLVDTGIGNNKLNDKQRRNYGVNEESNIDQSLEKLGLSSNDIDYVLMTHLHFDHACGLTKWENQKLVPAFKNAQVITSEIEWKEMKNPNIRSRNTYWQENWLAIEHMVEPFNMKREIDKGVIMFHTGGHSNGHSIVKIESNNELLIHMADIMPTHAHQNVLWVLAYDDYPMTSIAEKQKWMKLGLEQQAWFSFYHDAYYRAIKWNNEGEVIESLKRISPKKN
jgi:glyoxylase-like metal-dependent hydrolase (beta-lactamase superfamily II)